MAYNFSKVKVLVVESTPEMLTLFESVLHMLSVPRNNLDSVLSAEQGFSMFLRKNHDIVITDWLENPDKGISLIEQIRTHKKTPNKYVPIIMTAGSGHYKRVIRSRDAGVSEYLVKPFSANDLAMRIERVIESPRNFVVSDHYTGPDRRTKNVETDFPERRLQEQEVEDLTSA
jgi:DNA-binding response OmpR family regulator